MNTYETHIMPQECFVHAVFCNGDSIHTSVNPELSDDEIFKYYLGREFTFSRLDSSGNEVEIKSTVIRMMVTREEESGNLINEQMKEEALSISLFEEEVTA